MISTPGSGGCRSPAPAPRVPGSFPRARARAKDEARHGGSRRLPAGLRARARSYLWAPRGSLPLGPGGMPWQGLARSPPSRGRFICLLRPPRGPEPCPARQLPGAVPGGRRLPFFRCAWPRRRRPLALPDPDPCARGRALEPSSLGISFASPSASCPRAEFVSPLALRFVLPPRCFTLHP